MKKLREKPLIRRTLKSVQYLFLIIIGYVIIMLIGHFIPSQRHSHQNHTDESIEIYLISNGVHTDFVLPTKTAHMDWTTIFNPRDNPQHIENQWISIGWGDRNFYLNTPTWADLTASTAFYALSGLSQSAMHVSYEPDITVNHCQKCRKIRIDSAQYQQIIAHILSSLPHTAQQTAIQNAHYYNNDAFYPAVGSYNLFYTCNTWVNNGLKKANIKTALWTVTDFGTLKSRE